MKREILFRGLTAETKEWVFGDLVQWKSRGICAILPQEGDQWKNPFDFEVIPETVGQFNDNHKCYEGDKIMACWEDDATGGYLQMSDSYIERKEFGVCVWHNGAFRFKNEKSGKFINFPSKAVVTVIGNIHDK
jgi:hypothetical protein